MSDVETLEDLPPVAHATIVYLGPVAPHWELRGHFGEDKMLDDFWARVHARLLLLPKHDPQFRRNRERVNRDAERELIRLDWDLGDEDPPRQPRRERPPRAEAPAPAPAAEEAPANEVPADEAPADEAVVDAPSDEVVETPVEEASADVADEAPAEEAVADETAPDAPADEATDEAAAEAESEDS